MAFTKKDIRMTEEALNQPAVEYVKLTTDEYDAMKRTIKFLERRDFELQCLESGGVDNWEYYSDALQEGGFFDEEDD